MFPDVSSNRCKWCKKVIHSGQHGAFHKPVPNLNDLYFLLEQYESLFIIAIIAFARGIVHNLFANSNPPSLSHQRFKLLSNLAFMVIQDLTRSNVNISETNQWICCMKPKSQQALARMQKERRHPISAFRLGRAFFFV